MVCCLAPPPLVGVRLSPDVGFVLASTFYAPSAHPRHASLPWPLRRQLTLLTVWQARSEHTDIATLLIPAITAADAGFYLCVATSPAGTAEARIQVIVLPGAGPLGAKRVGRASQGSPEAYLLPFCPQLQVPAPCRSGLSPHHLL